MQTGRDSGRFHRTADVSHMIEPTPLWHFPSRPENASARHALLGAIPNVFPTALTIIVVLAVLVSFTCSLLEALLLSTPMSHAEALAKQGRAEGIVLRRLKQRPGRALSAILLINTVAGTLGGTLAGAASAAWALRAGLPDEQVLAVVAFVLGTGILIVGEIMPKVIAAGHWRRLGGPAAYATTGLVWILYPAVVVLDWFIHRVSGVGVDPGVTRDDMLAMSEMGRQSGAIATHETEVIANLLRLNLIRTRDVLTPRVDVFALQKEMTAQDVVTQHSPLRYSRMPVYGRNQDNIVGLVLRASILEACLAGRGATTLGELMTSIHVVPESKSLASLLDEFVKRHEHMFLVVNEYGGTEGIVTLEDVIESLLGVEINDEMDRIERMRELAITRLTQQKRAPAIVKAGHAPARSSASDAPRTAS